MSKNKTQPQTFVSYITNGELLSQSAEFRKVVEMKDFAQSGSQPELLPGELTICSCADVLQHIPFYEKTKYLTGCLHITNFKLSFITIDQDPQSPVYVSGSHRNKLLHNDDIPLSCVSALYEVSKGKKRRLVPGSSVPAGIKSLEIHLKNFRVYNFRFKVAPKKSAKMLLNAILHHCFPCRVELLFAFDFQGSTNTEFDWCRFASEEDWHTELKRLKVSPDQFKPVCCNKDFWLCDSLPEVTVIPSSFTADNISKMSHHFNSYRWPVWCYSHSNNAAILRMSAPLQDTMEVCKKYMEQLSAGSKHSVKELDLTVLQNQFLLPNLKEFQHCYEKLKEGIMTESFREVSHTDPDWLSRLESTHWLDCVRKCLGCSSDVAQQIGSNYTVLIKESHGRDFSAIISSLTQLMLDPYTWTIQGFQALIQKEWIALGHQFSERLSLVRGKDEVPLFLLFLDCVWQLTQQFPHTFEFSEIYLTTLWDTACLGLFETFIFDSLRQRVIASAANSHVRLTESTGERTSDKLMSCWDWSRQFNSKDQSLFINPLFVAHQKLGLFQQNSVPLQVSTFTCRIKLWSHNYLRWLTPVQIQNGGSPAEYLQLCHLLEELLQLEHRVQIAPVPMRQQPSIRQSRARSELLFGFGRESFSTPQRHSSGDVLKVESAPEQPRVEDRIISSSFPFAPTGARTYTMADASISLFLESGVLNDTGWEEVDSVFDLDVT